MKQPCYIGLEEARQVLAEMGVQLTMRQMQRAADRTRRDDASCRSSSIPSSTSSKSKRTICISVYFRKQVEAQRNLRPN